MKQKNTHTFQSHEFQEYVIVVFGDEGQGSDYLQRLQTGGEPSGVKETLVFTGMEIT